MPTNLTGSQINATYSQLLHVDGGPAATEKTVVSGTGVSTAFKIGTASASVGNIQLSGNTISALSGAVGITNVAITSGSVTGITDLAIADGGTGASNASDARTNLGLGTIATQAASSVSITGGSISGVTFSGSFSGMTLVEATTLATGNAAAGCNLNGSTLAADGTDSNIDLTLSPKGTGAVNIANVAITSGSGTGMTLVDATTLATSNAAAGCNLNGSTLAADGTDSNIDINITPKGTGEVNITNVDILSGKVPFSTITDKAYGSFSDITDQTGSTTAATAVKFGTNEITGAGISVANNGSGDPTRVTFTAAGTYMVAPNLQLYNSDTADHDVTIWLMLNGSNVARSATKVTVPKSTDGGTTFFQIVFYITVTAAQYIEVMWLPENTAVTIDHTAAAAGPPSVPAIPSAIIVAERIA